VWVTDDGNFCSPTGDASKRVDRYSRESPFGDLNEQVMGLTRDIAMHLDEGDDIRKKEVQAKAARESQKEIIAKNKTMKKEAEKAAAIRNLTRIFRDMSDNYGDTEEDLKAQAEAYYEKAEKCAKANLEKDVGETCAGVAECAVSSDPDPKKPKVCVPEALEKQVQDIFDGEDVNPTDRRTVARLANWWSEYYTNYTAKQKIRERQMYDILSKGRR
jgi:hypothetical protein